MFENKVLRKIFGAERDRIAGERRKLHNAELYALYSLSDIIRNPKSDDWDGRTCNMHGASQKCIQSFSGKT